MNNDLTEKQTQEELQKEIIKYETAFGIEKLIQSRRYNLLLKQIPLDDPLLNLTWEDLSLEEKYALGFEMYAQAYLYSMFRGYRSHGIY